MDFRSDKLSQNWTSRELCSHWVRTKDRLHQPIQRTTLSYSHGVRKENISLSVNQTLCHTSRRDCINLSIQHTLCHTNSRDCVSLSIQQTLCHTNSRDCISLPIQQTICHTNRRDCIRHNVLQSLSQDRVPFPQLVRKCSVQR